MGCWNETCGLSHLPIHEDDAAVLVILQRHAPPDAGRSGYTHPSDIWGPLYVPIRGWYDGYGQLRDPQFDERLLKEVLRSAKVAYSGGRLFFQKLAREELSGWSALEREAPIGQVLFRQDVWTSLKERTIRNQGMVSCYQDAANWAHKVRELQVLGNKDNWSTNWSKADVAYHIECQKSESLFLRFLESYESGPKLDTFRMALEQALGEADSPDEKRIFAAAVGVADIILVHAHMTRLRRSWAPTSGKGSQDTDWEAHRAFARLVAAVVDEQVDREYED